MVVLLDPIALLVLRHLIAKLVLAHQIAIDEQVHGVVKSSATDAMPLRGHVREQRIDVEVALVRVDLTENGKALRRLAVTVLLEVGFEKSRTCWSIGFVAAALSALLLCFPAAGVSDLLMVWAKILRVLKIRNYAGNC